MSVGAPQKLARYDTIMALGYNHAMEFVSEGLFSCTVSKAEICDIVDSKINTGRIPTRAMIKVFLEGMRRADITVSYV